MSVFMLACSIELSAQSDYITLDKKTYDYYLKGDYQSLKETTDQMLSDGIDYYYLRMRIAILSYNKQLYPEAVKHFSKALQFNSMDTVSNEYIYYSYLFSGRKDDAHLYLKSVPWNKRNKTLRSIWVPGVTDLFIGSSVSSNEVTLYETNNLYYEAVKSSFGFNVGLEANLSDNVKGVFVYDNFQKRGTVYSENDTTGSDLDFSQHQIYTRISRVFYPGWELSGFGHIAFYKEVATLSQTGFNRFVMPQTNVDYLLGGGIAKNGWRLRSGLNVSYSNFSYFSQIRGEGYLTYLPFGNLNLYFTTGGMYQNDKIWGGTYQVNQEIGFKVFNSLWVETGIVKGNAFLYARNQGSLMNNSFQTPATTIYANLIILPGKHFSISLMPYYSINQIYSWDLDAYTRTDKLNVISYGGAIKLIYKFK